MTTRREFLNGLTGAFCLASGAEEALALGESSPFDSIEEDAMSIADSDVGSLFPFIQSQAVQKEGWAY